MRFDHLELFTPRGILLIGYATDQDIRSLLKAVGQRRLTAAGLSALRDLDDNQVHQLRNFAAKNDLLPRPTPMQDRQITEVVLRAIGTGRIAAIYLPLPVMPQSQISAARTFGGQTVTTTKRIKTLSDMTGPEKVQYMLSRVPGKLISYRGIQQAFLALISPESIVLLAASFLALTAAQALGIGEIVDATLAGIAYYYAGLSGVWALLDMIKATAKAANAQRESEIEEATALFAGAVIVLGIAILSAILARRARAGAEGEPNPTSANGKSITRKGTGEQPSESLGKSKPAETPVNQAAQVARSGKALKNADKAVIDERKITDYSLNKDHPVGGNKARVFDSALGFNKENAQDLISQIRDGVGKNPATLGKLDQYGQRFTVDMPVTGPKGTGIVRTGWIYKPGSDVPSLTTAYMK